MSRPTTGFYLECNHLVAAINADRPCPVCAAVAQARADAIQECVEAVKNARGNYNAREWSLPSGPSIAFEMSIGALEAIKGVKK